MKLTEKLGNANSKIIEDVVQLAHKLYPKQDINKLRDMIWMHWFYGTMDVIYRGDKLIACVRWNVNSMAFEVLDLYIAKGENGIRIIKHFIARNWHRFPYVKYFSFERGLKYIFRSKRTYSINKLLHIKEK